ncbi:MAG: hypothetical protein QNJ73_10595 [Gammaproteobacteria bacterium]|nr:hypothetical protein [Gammaproteobacteria bacterium]
MAQRVQDQKPERDDAAKAWMKENVAEQKKRWKAIYDAQEKLWPKRKKWYKEFLQIIQTRGFNWDGDNLRKIPKKEIPKEPKRKHKVVF